MNICTATKCGNSTIACKIFGNNKRIHTKQDKTKNLFLCLFLQNFRTLLAMIYPWKIECATDSVFI